VSPRSVFRRAGATRTRRRAHASRMAVAVGRQAAVNGSYAVQCIRPLVGRPLPVAAPIAAIPVCARLRDQRQAAFGESTPDQRRKIRMYAQAMARSSTAAISMMGTGLVLIKMISMKGVYNIFACREPRGFCVFTLMPRTTLCLSLLPRFSTSWRRIS